MCLRVGDHPSTPVQTWLQGREVFMHTTDDLIATMSTLEKLTPCSGIIDQNLLEMSSLNTNSYFKENTYIPSSSSIYTVVRSKSCRGIGISDGVCAMCSTIAQTLRKKKVRLQQFITKVLATRAPLKNISKSKISVALKQERKRRKYLETQVKAIEKKI